MPSREKSRTWSDGTNLWMLEGRMTMGASRPDTDKVDRGHLHYDTGADDIEVWDGSSWTSMTMGAGGGDVSGPASSTDNAIARFAGTGGKTIQDSVVTVDDTTGNITMPALSTVDGRDLSVDGAKLDLIEDLADVTDATNVNAAGATMNADATLVGNAYFLDEDAMGSDDATKVASQQSIKAYADTKLADLIDDTSPQLGGNLDVNNNEITSTADVTVQLGDAAGVNKLIIEDSGSIEVAAIDSDGNITTSGTVDGIDIATDVAANTAKETNATHTGDVTGDTVLTIADEAVTYAKMQHVSATDRFLGRDTAGAGDVEEISPSAARTILNVQNGANNYSHPNHTGDVTSVGDGAQTIAADAVDNTKLANMAAATLKGRAAGGGTGDPGDLASADIVGCIDDREIPIAKVYEGLTANAVAVVGTPVPRDAEWLPLANNSLVCVRNSGSVTTITGAAANRWVGKGSSGLPNLAFLNMNRMVDSLIQDTAIAGTSFPSTAGAPQDGWPFYRTDLDMAFVYDGSSSLWLSVAEWTVDGYGSSSQGIAYLNTAGGAIMTATYGFSFRFPVVCTEVEVMTSASATGTWVVRDDGTTVESIALAAATQNAQKKSPTSGKVFAANSVVSIGQSVGTGIADPRVRATFRRRET